MICLAVTRRTVKTERGNLSVKDAEKEGKGMRKRRKGGEGGGGKVQSLLDFTVSFLEGRQRNAPDNQDN